MTLGGFNYRYLMEIAMHNADFIYSCEFVENFASYY